MTGHRHKLFNMLISHQHLPIPAAGHVFLYNFVVESLTFFEIFAKIGGVGFWETILGGQFFRSRHEIY